MSFTMKVGGLYETVGWTKEGHVVTHPKSEVLIVGRKADKKLKVVFEGNNGLQYNIDGHVIGYQAHINDLQSRKSKDLT